MLEMQLERTRKVLLQLRKPGFLKNHANLLAHVSYLFGSLGGFQTEFYGRTGTA